jgi:hypothetical protein
MIGAGETVAGTGNIGAFVVVNDDGDGENVGDGATVGTKVACRNEICIDGTCAGTGASSCPLLDENMISSGGFVVVIILLQPHTVWTLVSAIAAAHCSSFKKDCKPALYKTAHVDTVPCIPKNVNGTILSGFDMIPFGLLKHM